MQEVKVVDGGFSTQLSTHVGDQIDGDPLWTARFIAKNPDAVFATHLDFLRAGADIILTNTYQASIDGFEKYLDITEEESIKLFCKAVDFARTAVLEYKKEIKNTNVPNPNPLIAGSCGPYGACLHDASEYSGNYCSDVSEQVLMDWHRPRIKTLVNRGVDLLAIETIPCKIEAEALIKLLQEFPNTKAWISFSCRADGKSIADGTKFQDIAVKCYKNALPGQIVAVGVNCIAPQHVTALLKGINDSKKEFIPLVVYPNSGETYTVEGGWKKGQEQHSLHEYVYEWLQLGVRYIGGCCRTYDADVRKIRTAIENWKKTDQYFKSVTS